MARSALCCGYVSKTSNTTENSCGTQLKCALVVLIFLLQNCWFVGFHVGFLEGTLIFFHTKSLLVVPHDHPPINWANWTFVTFDTLWSMSICIPLSRTHMSKSKIASFDLLLVEGFWFFFHPMLVGSKPHALETRGCSITESNDWSLPYPELVSLSIFISANSWFVGSEFLIVSQLWSTWLQLPSLGTSPRIRQVGDGSTSPHLEVQLWPKTNHPRAEGIMCQLLWMQLSEIVRASKASTKTGWITYGFRSLWFVLISQNPLPAPSDGISPSPSTTIGRNLFFCSFPAGGRVTTVTTGWSLFSYQKNRWAHVASWAWQRTALRKKRPEIHIYERLTMGIFTIWDALTMWNISSILIYCIYVIY